MNYPIFEGNPNLKDDIMELLTRNGKTEQDVLQVCGRSFQIPVSDFWELADVYYDPFRWFDVPWDLQIIGSDFLIRFNVLAYRPGIKIVSPAYITTGIMPKETRKVSRLVERSPKDILENGHKQKCLEDFLQKEEDI